jgi:type I restriction enzyme S subunit
MNRFKLKDLIKIHNGTKYSHLNDGTIPLYGSGGIMSYVDDFLYDGEAVLLPRKGTLSNIMYTNGKIWTVDTMYYATTNEKVDPYYLYSYLSILDLKHLDSGSALPSMTKSAYDSLEINIPDILIQKEVSKLLSDLDAKIELNNKINQKLEAMAKTLYDYWFVQFDFPNENGKPYKTSGGKMVYNEVLKREIPDGWKNGTLDDIGHIIGGSTPSKADSNNFCCGTGTPWITPKDLSLNKGNKFITRGEFDVTAQGIKNASLKLMPKGTVLLSSRAPIGYLAISRSLVTTNQGFKSFIPDKGYTNLFVYYTVKTSIPTIINNAVGSTFKEVSGTTLKTIKISLPDKSILDLYNENVKSIFERQDLLELENQKLTKLRDWLLPMLMNGQVTIAEAEEQLNMAAEPSMDYKKN